jgi:endonuclease G, mitochondrial
MKHLLWLLALLHASLWASLPKHLPACLDKPAIITHTGYILHYMEKYEQPDWVAYDLSAAEVRGKVERADHFRPDPTVTTGSATPDDYRGSGYDRGHLAPAGDMKWSEQAMDDSFFMSNMSPQTPAFNRGIWNRLESKVRDWAVADGELCVVTGPVLSDGPYETIGKDQVAVPKFYYKVLYCPSKKQAVGFILPNAKGEKPPVSYALSVDEVERITGLDFFPDLPDSLETRIESAYDPAAWPE